MRVPSRLSHLARRWARQLAALLALALLSSQFAAAAHFHADDPSPHGHDARSCELCVTSAPAAPAPVCPAVLVPRLPSLVPVAQPFTAPAIATLDRAHRSRAPPTVHCH